MNQNTYYDITKEYPTMYRVMIYKTPYTPKPRLKEIMNQISSKFPTEDNIERSIRRTRRTLHDYVLCNDFDLFATFTFDPKKIDRYDINAVYSKMSSWLWYQQRKDPNFKYLIVPERHKDGALHFHALMQNAPFDLKKTNVIQDSRRVYNIIQFRYGFTAVTHLPQNDPDAKSKAGNYISKYISKDMVIIHGKHRYKASRNLEKPLTYYNSIYDTGIHKHINFKTNISDNEYNSTYEVPKDLLDL